MAQEHIPERIVQELVPGKEITIAHLIASPDITLYEKLGFVTIGTVAEGFQKKDGTYSDIVLYYFPLQNEPTAEA